MRFTLLSSVDSPFTYATIMRVTASPVRSSSVKAIAENVDPVRLYCVVVRVPRSSVSVCVPKAPRR